MLTAIVFAMMPQLGGSNGWTTFTPSSDTRKVYVSSSGGNDSNNGLSVSTPKQTIAGGKAIMRDGYPDWLLLKRGDSWSENFDDGSGTGEWRMSGRSATERMLISNYDTGTRPTIDSGTHDGIDSSQSGTGNYVAMVGIHIMSSAYDGSQGGMKGVQWIGSTDSFLMEDCYVEGFEQGVVVIGSTGRTTNVKIRRNEIVDAYSTGTAHAVGLYVDAVDTALIEQNLFDHNGWGLNGSVPDIYRRNVYIQNGCTGITFNENIVASTDGLQLRPGGTCTNNLFLQNAISLQLGSGNTPESSGVSGTVENNVILDGNDLQDHTSNARGWGLVMGNISSATVDHNIIAHNSTGSAPAPWVLNFDNGHGNPVGMNNTNFNHNIAIDWGAIGYGSMVYFFQPNVVSSLTFSYNDFEDATDSGVFDGYFRSSNTPTASHLSMDHNHWYLPNGSSSALFSLDGTSMSFISFLSAVSDTTSSTSAVSYPDSSRTISTYMASLGSGTGLSGFLSKARQQSKTAWSSYYMADAVNDYIRAGFGW